MDDYIWMGFEIDKVLLGTIILAYPSSFIIRFRYWAVYLFKFFDRTFKLVH